MANGSITAVKNNPVIQGKRVPSFDMPEPLEQSPDSGWDYLLDGVFLSIVSGCLFFFRLGSVGLFDGAGASFAESAREMVETGNYVVPQLNFQVVFNKPILSYWLTSTAYNIFGVNEFAAHFWAAVLASILVACTYCAVRQLADRNAALFSSLILACAPLTVLYSRVSCDQMVFCTTLGFALCATVAGVFLKHKVWLIPGYACLGLSVLANGPTGLLIFAAAFAIYFLAARPKKEQMRALLKNTHPAWGLPVLAVVCLPWFCCAAVMTNGVWTKAFFASHTWFTLAGPANYVRAFTAFAWGFAPWILFLPDALKMAFAYGGKNNQGWRARRLNVIEQAQGQGLLFCASYVVAVLALVPFSQAQTSGYILALVAPCSVLVGVRLSQWASRTSVHVTPRVWRVFCLFLAIAAPLGALAGAVAIHVLFENMPPVITGLGLAGCVAFWVGMTLQYGLFRSERIRASIATVVYTFVVCTALFAPVAFDIAYRCLQQDLYTLTTEVRQRGGQVVLYKSFAPSVLFYLQRPVDCIFDSQSMVKDSARRRPMYVLAKTKAAAQLCAEFPGQVNQLDQHGDWRLLLARHMTLVRPVQPASAPVMNRLQIQSPYCAGNAPERTKFHRWM
jgi:4-amino-4-deoxy-L-arabinose transferase-like glycosyltransferase